MPDFPDAQGYYFYVPSRLMWKDLFELVLDEGYTLTQIDDEDDYYIFEVGENYKKGGVAE